MKTVSDQQRKQNMLKYSELRNANKNQDCIIKADENGLIITNAKK